MCSLDSGMPGLKGVMLSEVGCLLIGRNINGLFLNDKSQFTCEELEGLPLAFDKVVEYLLKDDPKAFWGIFKIALSFFAQEGVLKYAVVDPSRGNDTIYAVLQNDELALLAYRAIWRHEMFHTQLNATMGAHLYSAIFNKADIASLDVVKFNHDVHFLALSANFKAMLQAEEDVMPFLLSVMKGDVDAVDKVAQVARSYMTSIKPDAKKIPWDWVLNSLQRGLSDAFSKHEPENHPFTLYVKALLDSDGSCDSPPTTCTCAT